MLSVIGRDLVVLLPQRLLCLLPVVRFAEMAVCLHRSRWPVARPARHVVGPERFLDHGCVRGPADQGELLPADQHPELVAEHLQRVVDLVGVVPADVPDFQEQLPSALAFGLLQRPEDLLVTVAGLRRQQRRQDPGLSQLVASSEYHGLLGRGLAVVPHVLVDLDLVGPLLVELLELLAEVARSGWSQ